MPREKEKYKDPFEEMAKDIVKAGKKFAEKTKKSKPDCPNCGEELWRRKDGKLSCTNPECGREVIAPEEVATRKIMEKFLNNL